MPASRLDGCVGEVGDRSRGELLVVRVERQAPRQLAGLNRHALRRSRRSRRRWRSARCRSSRARSATAPVSVARSTTRAAPCSRTHHVSASARISRPSASVLLTSTVLPFSWVMMSPGRIERPEGMFSVEGTTATMSRSMPSSAIAPIASITAAPPDMSIFISCMPADGLIEMPPESKVTALPTMPSTSPDPRPEWRSVIRRGSS